MSAVQRRFFAACIFLFSFIFYFESRGERLIPIGIRETPVSGPELNAHFWQHIGIGTFILMMGIILLIVLRRPEQKLEIPRGELMAFALGIGILIGTAIVSWVQINHLG